MKFRILCISLLAAGLISCGGKNVPKPHGYFRIDFPDKSYKPLPLDYPYSFKIPGYSSAVPDNSREAEPGWINIEIPGNKAEVHISYKVIRNNLFVYTEESRRLAYEHTLKASSLEEEIYQNPAKRVFGTIYYINGNAASPLQFYMTDSTRHFLRGALYIRATPSIDSLRPVIDFLKTDVIRMIETLEWRE